MSTRKQAISLAVGFSWTKDTDIERLRADVASIVNARPDEDFDPEDPVGDVGPCLMILSGLKGVEYTDQEVQEARDAKAAELWAEFLAPKL